jgi:hypothetical protein
MPRLIPCPSCHSHVLLSDSACPSCGATLRTTTAPRVATTLLLGLALAGCPGEDGDDSAGDSAPASTSATDGTTTTDGATSTTNATTTTTADSITISGSGDAAYGVPDTGLEDTTATDTGTGTETETGTETDTVGEPEYGVPETTTDGMDTVGEPDYGVPETTTE